MTETDDRLSVVQKYKPYFTAEELKQLIESNATKVNPVRVEERRQLACSFIQALGTRLGFPRRTMASAQVLYHRFHLFFHDVCLAAMLIATKLEDTLKKLKDIQVAGFQVRNKQEGGSGLGEPDAQKLEYDKNKLIGIERLMLETISFHFNIRASSSLAGSVSQGASTGNSIFGYVVKIALDMEASRELAELAFNLAVDVHRTLAPLSYPAHTIALACLYLASFFDPQHPHSKPPLSDQPDWPEGLTRLDAGWARHYVSDIQDIETIAHMLLDVLTVLAPNSAVPQLSRSTKSPFEPSPADSFKSSTSSTMTSADFTQIKIRLRAKEERRKSTEAAPPAKRRKLETEEARGPFEAKDIYGKDDLSVRFQFTE